ncbi:putative Ig domain-containing protein [Pelagicoccus mobilis]|uniref:Ig domain-containing protein n=1 Tax=Pelagicoccus mobilis TaxID=415221 RepID=A0A934RVY1_9BACT|nr:putative Ig domain-containing protein [Pelagicoccus mobilis]MBK1877481.1 putative Ig domain-containing protein [Pelagicoccus mobilis]
MNKATTTSPTLLRFALFITVSISLCAAALAQRLALPDAQVGVDYEFKITPSIEVPSDTKYTADGLPPQFAISESEGTIIGDPVAAGEWDDITITLSYSDPESDDIIDNNFYFTLTITAASGTPNITSATLDSGTVGQAFSYTITADNDPQSYNATGELPAGVTVSGDTISGTPTDSGTFPIVLSSNNSLGTGPETTLTITIDPAGPVPVISSAATLSGEVNEQLSYQIVASETPTSYSASGLPPGDVDINTETGFISGSPSSEGIYIVQLKATNANGTSEAFELTITVGDVPQISSSLSINLTEYHIMDDYQLSASNNPTTFTFDAEYPLPAGLSYNSTTRKITGIPTEAGTFDVRVTPTNGVGDGVESTIVITVAEKPAAIQPRPATYSVVRSGSAFELYLEFDQSVGDLDAYNWKIETSTDLDTWTPLDLDDSSLTVTITDNEDNSKSVKVQYPNIQPTDTMIFIRYRVETKE